MKKVMSGLRVPVAAKDPVLLIEHSHHATRAAAKITCKPGVKPEAAH